MCDCYIAKCMECSRELPVHIGDFSTDRDNVLVRCKKHKPPSHDPHKWVLFKDVVDTGSDPWKLGDWYMAIDCYDDVSVGYDVGTEGDIVPNCYEWAGEEVVMEKARKQKEK